MMARVIPRASLQRQFQQGGSTRWCMGRLSAMAMIVLAVSAASATVASAAHPHTSHVDAAAADAVVAKLRDLPLPLVRVFPQGVPPGKATPPPLPALESRRQKVYDALHSLGPPSIPALARALRDPDPEMRRNVAVAMDVVGGGWWQFPDGNSRLDLRPALPALLTALQDTDPGIRSWAAQDISDMGAGAVVAVPHLRAMLHSPDAGSRGIACGALGRIGGAAGDALPDLRAALADSSPEVRQAARDAITSIGRAGAAP
jgi:HEAT repeat protein